MRLDNNRVAKSYTLKATSFIQIMKRYYWGGICEKIALKKTDWPPCNIWHPFCQVTILKASIILKVSINKASVILKS